jgi:hypothetical protein
MADFPEHQEWIAWRAFVHEFSKLNPKLDFDSEEVAKFVRAVKLWGEELAALRRSHEESVCVAALERARADYDPNVILEKDEAGGHFGGGKTSDFE